jgi:hypothetical protein
MHNPTEVTLTRKANFAEIILWLQQQHNAIRACKSGMPTRDGMEIMEEYKLVPVEQ